MTPALMNRAPVWAQRSQAALIKLYINQKNYPLARLELNDLFLSSADRQAQKDRLEIDGYLCLLEYDVDGAIRIFTEAGDDSLVDAARTLQRLPKKNPTLSTLFSTIIPGTGEIYCNRYRIGISALVANALTVGGIVYSIKNKKYVDAVLIFSFLFHRFYFGSQRNARDFAVDYNEAAYERRAAQLIKAHDFQKKLADFDRP